MTTLSFLLFTVLFVQGYFVVGYFDPLIDPSLFYSFTDNTTSNHQHADPTPEEMFDRFSSNPPKFGHSMLSEFAIDPKYIQVNHGSFGGAPRYVLQRRNHYTNLMESAPDKFYRSYVHTALNTVLQRVGKLVNAPASNIVFIPNTSTGISTILKSFHNQTVLSYSSTYYKKTLKLLKESNRLENVACKIQSLAHHDIVARTFHCIEKRIQKRGSPPDIMLVDHISSIPAAIWPVDRLIDIGRRYNMTIIVDGAHAVGQIPIDIGEMKPDFYVSNFHKWFYTPKGTAFLYVSPDYVDMIQPLVLSVGSWCPDNSPLGRKFCWQGTTEYSSYLAISDAFDFREAIGGELAIQTYTHNLIIKASSAMNSILHKNVTFRSESGKLKDMHISLVADVNTPSLYNIMLPECRPDTLEKLATKFFEHNTYAPVFLFKTAMSRESPQIKCYVRISAQIYNEIEDYIKLSNIIVSLLENY